MEIRRFVYIAESEGRGLIKIGCSQNPVDRVESLRNKFHRLWLLGYERGTFERERNYHRMFSSLRLAGEWFRDDPQIRLVAKDMKSGEIPIFHPDAFLNLDSVALLETQYRFNQKVFAHMARITKKERTA